MNENGIPILIEGVREQLQRAFIRLSVRRGIFCYDPTLGSRFYTLSKNDSDLNGKALFLAQEALRNIPGVTVLGVVCSVLQEGSLSVTVSLQTAEGKGNITVEGE